jgi:UDP-4-amino-4,6-dideoxy-N-acetyl-beta-L-altrosamine N-acetyltransferase
MIVKFENVYIRELVDSDLEMVRRWRNHPTVKRHLYTQVNISQDDQLKWFEQQIKSSNRHFIIGAVGEDIGLISLTDFNKLKTSCTSNIFIGNLDYHNNQYPIILSIIFTIMGFDLLKIKEVKAEVLFSNLGAIKLNELLGFKRKREDKLKNAILYTFTPKDFEKEKSKLLKLLKLYYNRKILHMEVNIRYFDLPTDEEGMFKSIELN